MLLIVVVVVVFVFVVVTLLLSNESGQGKFERNNSVPTRVLTLIGKLGSTVQDYSRRYSGLFEYKRLDA